MIFKVLKVDNQKTFLRSITLTGGDQLTRNFFIDPTNFPEVIKSRQEKISDDDTFHTDPSAIPDNRSF